MNSPQPKLSDDAIIRKILIVDDDKGLRSILARSFAVIGFECHEAKDAFKALERIDNESFDLIISDISMPKMDGIQFMKRAKSSYPDLDFIIMTGYAGDYSYVDIIGAGASDYMSKPFGINSAVARIERIDREKRTLLNLKKSNAELNLAIKKAEQLAEKAKAASRAKTDFLANMSHEIRTPLNGILGYIDIFYDTDLTYEQKEYVQNAKISCEVLLSVVNDILDFSKVEAGRLSVEQINFDPEILFFEALEVVRGKVDESRVELSCKISDDVPGFVIGDPYRYRQVLLNLLGNAAKFTTSGVIELSLTVDDETEESVLLHSRLKDTGIGIHTDRLQKIFEPFQQSDETTTRKYGGTGLGLAICRKIAEKMGGEVWAESQAGQGSTFHFTCRVSKETNVRPKRLRPVSLKGKRAFLSIAKQSPLREVLQSELSLAGMEITMLDAGTDPKVLLESGKESWDIGIVDAPFKSTLHLAFAEQLRQLPSPISKVPLLVCNSPEPGGADRCSRAGYDGFLTKPVQRKKLFQMLSALMGGAEDVESSARGEAAENKVRTSAILTTHSLAESVKHSASILLVEDNPVNQKMAKIMLTRAGYQVTIAGNGVEAVELYANEGKRFDLIFMDINMPVMDGLEATCRIREIETDRRIPVVALTANALKEFEEKCIHSGMDDFLTKPLKRELVFQTVRKWVGDEA